MQKYAEVDLIELTADGIQRRNRGRDPSDALCGLGDSLGDIRATGLPTRSEWRIRTALAVVAPSLRGFDTSLSSRQLPAGCKHSS